MVAENPRLLQYIMEGHDMRICMTGIVIFLIIGWSDIKVSAQPHIDLGLGIAPIGTLDYAIGFMAFNFDNISIETLGAFTLAKRDNDGLEIHLESSALGLFAKWHFWPDFLIHPHLGIGGLSITGKTNLTAEATDASIGFDKLHAFAAIALAGLRLQYEKISVVGSVYFMHIMPTLIHMKDIDIENACTLDNSTLCNSSNIVSWVAGIRYDLWRF